MFCNRIRGQNLAIKEPGTRGQTKSANSKKSINDIKEAVEESPKNISAITELAEVTEETQQRADKKEVFKKEDSIDAIKFNASHLIADWFQGSGYALALNLVGTSAHYNKQVMFEKESGIIGQLRKKEKIYKKKDSNVAYLTFDMQVTAEWMPIKDNDIEGLLARETKSNTICN